MGLKEPSYLSRKQTADPGSIVYVRPPFTAFSFSVVETHHNGSARIFRNNSDAINAITQYYESTLAPPNISDASDATLTTLYHESTEILTNISDVSNNTLNMNEQ